MTSHVIHVGPARRGRPLSRKKTLDDELHGDLYEETQKARIGDQPAPHTCRRCKKSVSLAEAACYGSVCENCYVGSSPRAARAPMDPIKTLP